MTSHASTGCALAARYLGWACALLLGAACAALGIVSLQGCTTTRLPDGTTVKTTMAAATITPGKVEANADRAIDRIAQSPEKALELWQRSGQTVEK